MSQQRQPTRQLQLDHRQPPTVHIAATCSIHNHYDAAVKYAPHTTHAYKASVLDTNRQSRQLPSCDHCLRATAEADIMSEERLWKFRKPEWLNSATARSLGVYASGALVCLPAIQVLVPLAECWASCVYVQAVMGMVRLLLRTFCANMVPYSLVLHVLLLHARCLALLCLCAERLGSADPHLIHRLATAHLFVPGHAHHQLD